METGVECVAQLKTHLNFDTWIFGYLILLINDFGESLDNNKPPPVIQLLHRITVNFMIQKTFLGTDKLAWKMDISSASYLQLLHRNSLLMY